MGSSDGIGPRILHPFSCQILEDASDSQVIGVNWVIEKRGIQLTSWSKALWLEAAVKK